jgi:hypothetical protein
MLAKPLQRAGDPARRHVRCIQRARGAQHDQILEGEQILAARTPRRRYEAGLDETAYRAARHLQHAFYIAYAVGGHEADEVIDGFARREETQR